MSKPHTSLSFALISALAFLIASACSKNAPTDDISGQPPGSGDASGASHTTGISWPPQEIVIEKALLDPQTCPMMEHNSGSVVGGDGSLFVVTEPDGQTTISKCTADGQAWSVALGDAEEVAIRGMDVYYGQRPPGLVGKVTSDGSPAWSVPGPPGAAVLTLAASRNGVYVVGLAKKPLPDQPSGSKGGHFVAKFDAAGKREWLRQSRDFGRGNDGSIIVSDPTGGVFVQSSKKLFKLDDSGAVVWSKRVNWALWTVGAVDAKGAIYYGMDRGEIVLGKLAPGGEQLWSVTPDTIHTRTIDPFEGFRWHGELLGGTVVPTADTLYYIGKYRNTYQHNSQSRKMHHDLLVLALDPNSGRPRWAHQYRVAPIESPEKRVDFTFRDAAATADGDLVVLGNANQGPWLKDGSFITSEQHITMAGFRLDTDGNLVY